MSFDDSTKEISIKPIGNTPAHGLFSGAPALSGDQITQATSRKDRFDGASSDAQELSVAADAANDAEVGTVTLPEGSVNAPRIVSITAGNEAGVFAIDQDGVLSIDDNSGLAEGLPFSLTVVATYQTSPMRSHSVAVTVSELEV